MKGRAVFLVLVIQSSLLFSESTQNPVRNEGESGSISAEKIVEQLQQRFRKQFDSYLKDPKSYKAKVERECRWFPEGDLFPYLYPAMAYVNIALKNPAQKKHCARQAKTLIDLAIHSVTGRVSPDGKLEGLRTYRQHATYLGQLNLALGAYALIADDDPYQKLHKTLSDVLYNALVKTKGRPLESYPSYSWPFDTIPVLVSLSLYDLKTSGTRSKKVVAKHLAWVKKHATDTRTGVPFSIVDNQTGKASELPRGCDLSFRLCLLPHIDKSYASRLYDSYVKNFWLDRGVVAGFAEWPKGKEHFQDVDSGPVVMGIGLGATGLGVGTVIAMEDKVRQQRLFSELASVNLLKPLFLMAQRQVSEKIPKELRMIKLKSGYFTGFLLGDAMLFYCITWCPWQTSQ